MKKLLITGGAGFIGSNYVRGLIQQGIKKVIVVDKLTYAGNLKSLEEVQSNSAFEFEELDIAEQPAMEALLKKSDVDGIVNFAAETHVDRSIDDPSHFIHTNIVGAYSLLEASKKYLAHSSHSSFRFLHISTDEVYGDLGETGKFKETTPYAPSSPYSASKASADHLVYSYFRTFGLPVVITNCSNNYGPNQFPEKLIPLIILNALEGKNLPIYGDGKNVRDWLFVEDHCSGINAVLEKGKLGEKYNIGGNNEWANIDIVNKICEVLDQLKPPASNAKLKSGELKSYKQLITFVKDRPGHDRRYAIDSSKIQMDLNWKPLHTFESGIKKTIQWYLNNLSWCEAVQSGKYNRERLGVKG